MRQGVWCNGYGVAWCVEMSLSYSNHVVSVCVLVGALLG